MTDCLFCKIIKKEIPAEVVYENDDVLAFKDVNPAAPVHVLVVPKKHIAGINDITSEDSVLFGRIQFAIKEIAEKLELSSDGYRVVVNSGKNAGQLIGHVHYHLLGGRKFTWPAG